MAGWNVFVLIAALSMPTLAGAAIGDIRLDDKIHSMEKAGVGPVVFPHGRHEKLYRCVDCHPGIFKDRRGANDISMKSNMNRKFCGSPNCHNSRKAFPLYMCAKCHTNVRAD